MLGEGTRHSGRDAFPAMSFFLLMCIFRAQPAQPLAIQEPTGIGSFRSSVFMSFELDTQEKISKGIRCFLRTPINPFTDKPSGSFFSATCNLQRVLYLRVELQSRNRGAFS